MWAQFLPAMLQAGGTLREGRDSRMQAEMLKDNARLAQSQATADEEAMRRESRIALGRQFAAAAEAGAGTGGSAGDLRHQSVVIAALDALNVRYGGKMRSRSLMNDAMTLESRGKSAGLLAGAQLLAGSSRAHTRQQLLRG